jgi:Ni/Fe-hydrogenase subunit HybB-like protein
VSHAHEHIDMPARRIEAVSSGLRIATIALILIGAIAFAAALATDAARAWRAWYMNWIFFMGIAQGGFMLAVVTYIAKGIWSRSVRRIALAHVAYLPIAFVAVLPLLSGTAAHHIWPWIEHPVAGKDVWLNLPFLRARTIFGLALLQGISLWFAYAVLRPDMGLMRDAVPPRLHGLYQRFTRNWRGQEIEELQAHRRLSVLAPASALIYALIMGMIAWDFVMSLEPDWFSTLIGPFFFMAAFLAGLMTTALIVITLRSKLALHDWILPSTLHDLGKLCFGFTIFWAYLFFSQYIVIWYGLLPHEQEFVIHRFVVPFRIIAQLVGLFVFVVPFFGLISVTAKRTPAIFATFASISLFGLWLERYLLTYPSFYIGAERLPLSWQEPFVALLFAGLYLAAIAFFLTRVPLFHLWQPPTELELQGIEVSLEEERYHTGDLGGAGSVPD